MDAHYGVTCFMDVYVTSYDVVFLAVSKVEIFVQNRSVRLRVAQWCNGRVLDLRSVGRGFKSHSEAMLRNNLGQVVHTYVPLSPSSITWYRPKGGDALRQGR